MDYSSVYENNIVILSKIENGTLTDQEEIKNIFCFVKKQIKYLEKNIIKSLKIYFYSYLKFTFYSIYDPFFQAQEFKDYKKLLILNLKSFLYLEKCTIFIKKKNKKISKDKDYSNLCFLYTIMFFIISSKEIKTINFNNKSLEVQSLIKGYYLDTNRETLDDTIYESSLRKSILEYKKGKN